MKATVIEGTFEGNSARIAIVAARWNGFIVNNLVQGAFDALKRHGIQEESITLTYCPGCYEIPLITQTLAKSKKYDAIITLGAVIRGATPHFDYVASEVSKGVAQVGLESGIPCIFGVLTTDTIEQAIERAGTKAGNKGAEAGMAAIEMISLMNKLR
ncbi:MAG: 6,7-dimethyl-8-ribityllumazine synthase [Ignavibacteria bacterium]|nr:6,7-dimethyl-8-ribityllumazine synthase [Ignavibacteria bacterium]